MNEVKSALITNIALEQFTCFNLPLIEKEFLTSEHKRSIYEYEKLFDQYLSR